MKVYITKTIADKVKDFNVTALSFKVNIEKSNEETLKAIDEKINEYLNMPLEEVINLSNIKDARDGYKKMGKDPSRYRLACESLLRRIAKGMGLYYINNMVDIGNLLSITLNKSVAVLDYDKIVGDVNIRLGLDSDEYYGIGRGLLNVSNIPLYCDDIGPFGSPTSDTMRTAISDDTKNVLLFVISFSDKDLDKDKSVAIDLFKRLGNVRDIIEIEVIK